MLQLSSTFANRPVLSLRTGTAVATILQPIINPNNLKIEGFYVQDGQDRRHQLVLLYQDIRDIIPQGFVVNDHDVLSEPDELVRLKGIMQLNYEMIGKQVVTTSKEKLGKVSDFAAETTTMYIQKIYVSQSIFKNFAGGNLGIDRTQIVEVNDKKVIVNNLEGRIPAHAGAVA